MNRFKQALVTLCVGGALLAAPGAYADSYHYGDRYYYGDGDDRYEYRDHRYRHDRYERRWHKGPYKRKYGHGRRHPPDQVIHHHVYRHEPARGRVPEHRYRDRGIDYGYDGYQSATPLILGGIIGGVLGNQVGKGRGRDAATVAGALLGGSIGRDLRE